MIIITAATNVLLNFIDPATWFFEVFLNYLVEILLYVLYGMLGILLLMFVLIFFLFFYAIVYKIIDYGTANTQTVKATITNRQHFFGEYSGSQYWWIDVVIPSLDNMKGTLSVSRSTYEDHQDKEEIELRYAMGCLSNKVIVPGLKS